MHWRTSTILFCGLASIVFPQLAAGAQTADERGQLVVTVTDPSGAVIVGASVELTGLEDATRRASALSVQTGGQGNAVFAELAAGRFRLRAEFPGFEPAQRDIRIRAGENRQTLTLDLQRVSEEVTVGVDALAAAVDARGGFYLTREMIEVLPDDPVEMAQALMGMAGTDVIHIDGFEGGVLPPKSQIRSIHISQDAFAAEYHAPGGRVDVVTKVGDGPLTGGLGYTASDEAKSANGRFRFQGSGPDGKPRQLTPTASFSTSALARSPFAATIPDSSDRFVSADFSGTIVPQKSSFSVNAYADRFYAQPLLNAALLSGNRAEVADFKARLDYDQFSTTFNYSLAHDHSARVQYSFLRDYLTYGVGGYDLPGRGEVLRDTSHSLRLQESGPLGKRGFINSRLEIAFWRDSYQSETEAPITRVLDAFTSGGSQSSGGSRSSSVNLGSDIDYVRGIHSVRTGFQIDADDNHSDFLGNYLGTYTFESLADYQAGRPRSFTRVIGDPRIDYWFVQAGVYVQDDIRLRKNLVLSPGIRYETQKHLNDHANWAPRFGVNWAPGKPGQTAIRASWGIFYTWMGAGVYERTLRFGGGRQDEINIADPAYLAAPAAGPSNRYRLDEDLDMPRVTRLALSLNQRLSSKVRLTVGYTGTRGSDQFRGQNLNAPVGGGVRPDPGLANVIEVRSDARSTAHGYNASFNINLAGVASAPAGFNVSLAGIARAPAARAPASSAASAAPKRVDWSRLNFTFGYSYNDAWDDSAGPFEVPPSGDLASEWSRADAPRHQANFNVNSTVFRNLTVILAANWASREAYTLYTGVDANGDLIFNDRPAGIRRNTERGDDRLMLRAQIRYSISGGSTPAAGAASSGRRPYRLDLSVTATNLTNRQNYFRYSGVMTSPFFHSPTAVRANAFGPRVVSGGLNLSF
jgi:hypothetical protein